MEWCIFKFLIRKNYGYFGNALTLRRLQFSLRHQMRPTRHHLASLLLFKQLNMNPITTPQDPPLAPQLRREKKFPTSMALASSDQYWRYLYCNLQAQCTTPDIKTAASCLFHTAISGLISFNASLEINL